MYDDIISVDIVYNFPLSYMKNLKLSAPKPYSVNILNATKKALIFKKAVFT